MGREPAGRGVCGAADEPCFKCDSARAGRDQEASGRQGVACMLLKRSRRTLPGGKPRGLWTSSQRQTWTATLPPFRALLKPAAREAASCSVSFGSRSSPSGLRTTTWEPDSAATWNQKSFGAPKRRERMSLSSAVRPTRMVRPSGETNRRATLRPCHIPFSGSGGGGRSAWDMGGEYTGYRQGREQDGGSFFR